MVGMLAQIMPTPTSATDQLVLLMGANDKSEVSIFQSRLNLIADATVALRHKLASENSSPNGFLTKGQC
jgi:hypothetical protein